MVNRLYTDGISPIYQLSASRHEEKLLLPAQILAWCLSEMFFEHSGEVLWVFESQLLGRVWASACQPPPTAPEGASIVLWDRESSAGSIKSGTHRRDASLISFLLHYHFAAVPDVDALRGGLLVEALAVERVPDGM